MDGSKVLGLAAGVIEVNERLPAATRSVLGDARRAVRNGHLQHAWVRNRLVFVRHQPGISPVCFWRRDHLRALISGAPLSTQTLVRRFGGSSWQDPFHAWRGGRLGLRLCLGPSGRGISETWTFLDLRVACRSRRCSQKH